MRKFLIAAAVFAGLGGPAAAQDGQAGPWLFVTLPDGAAVGWGNLSLDHASLVAAGMRFVLYSQPQSMSGFPFRWEVQRFYIDCKAHTIMIPGGQVLDEDRQPLRSTQPVPDKTLDAGPVDDLLKLSICDGQTIAGQVGAATVQDAMDRAVAAMKVVQARQAG